MIHKYLDVIDFLIGIKEIDINIKDKDGILIIDFIYRTALLNAFVKMRSISDDSMSLIINALLSRDDIDVNCQDIIQILKLFYSNQTPLFLALTKGNLELFENLLNKKDIDVNIQNNDGNTPLHLAIENNKIEFVASLIKNDKCNLCLTNNDNMTPLLLAFMYEHKNIVNLLLSAPRDININFKDENGILL